jgi:hypothetical protein
MHEKQLALVQRLLPKHARPVTFIQLSAVTGGFPGEAAGDPRSPPARSVTTPACFVEPDSLQRLGLSTKIDQLLQTSDRICLVSGIVDLAGMDEMIDDDGLYYKVQGMETLRPGTRTLLHFVGVER